MWRAGRVSCGVNTNRMLECIHGHLCGSQYEDGRMLSATEQVALLMARITRQRPGLLLLRHIEVIMGLPSRDSGGVKSSAGNGTSRVLASFSRIEARNARIASMKIKSVSIEIRSSNQIEAHHDLVPWPPLSVHTRTEQQRPETVRQDPSPTRLQHPHPP